MVAAMTATNAAAEQDPARPAQDPFVGRDRAREVSQARSAVVGRLRLRPRNRGGARATHAASLAAVERFPGGTAQVGRTVVFPLTGPVTGTTPRLRPADGPRCGPGATRSLSTARRPGRAASRLTRCVEYVRSVEVSRRGKRQRRGGGGARRKRSGRRARGEGECRGKPPREAPATRRRRREEEAQRTTSPLGRREEAERTTSPPPD